MSYPQFSGYTLGSLVQSIADFETNMMRSLTGTLAVSDNIKQTKTFNSVYDELVTGLSVPNVPAFISKNDVFGVGKGGKVRISTSFLINKLKGSVFPMEGRNVTIAQKIYKNDILTSTFVFYDSGVNEPLFDITDVQKETSIDLFANADDIFSIEIYLEIGGYVSTVDEVQITNVTVNLCYDFVDYQESEVI